MRYINDAPITIYVLMNTEYGSVVEVFTNLRVARKHLRAVMAVRKQHHLKIVNFDQRRPDGPSRPLCKKHPRYMAIRKPTCNCAACLDAFLTIRRRAHKAGRCGRPMRPVAEVGRVRAAILVMR